MPRFTLTALEHEVLSAALLDYAITNNLTGGTALVAAAATTMAELHTVSAQYLNSLRAKKVTAMNAVPAQSAAATAAFTAEIAAIDSALAKL